MRTATPPPGMRPHRPADRPIAVDQPRRPCAAGGDDRSVGAERGRQEMIEAGPETDLAVAQACGFCGKIHDCEHGRYVTIACKSPPLAKFSFCPSIDMNDAMRAAEAF